MRFEILFDRFERRGEETPYGTIPLRSTATKRDFFLDHSARHLLDLEGNVHDFDDEFGGEETAVRKSLLDGLRLLAAFGGAKLLPDEPRDPAGFCFRVSGEQDYKGAAALINDGGTRRLGPLPRDETAMNEDNLRARQFNNLEYLFLCLRGGEIAAVLITAMPKAESLSAAFRICGIALSEKLSRKEEPGVIRGLLKYVVAAFEGEFAICRYLSFEKSDGFVPILKSNGFTRTARLEKETASGGDVTVYDLRIKKQEIP